jgi:peptidyl-prolyl cis-trans isomerase-like 2
MANKGRNTNTSQLYYFVLSLILTPSFITYRPVPHLDRKHTVFGKVVGGLEVLDKLEAIPTDHDEKPEQDIKINKLLIFVDPFDVILFKMCFLISRNGKGNGRIKNLMINRRKKMPRKRRKRT